MHSHAPTLAVPLALVALLAGCGGTARRFGDDGGVPVAVVIDLDRSFVNEMRNRQARPSVGAAVGVSSGGHGYGSGVATGVGIGLSFSSTTVYLMGGEGPGQAQVFRQELKWGAQSFTVPLTPGRTLHLSVQAQGGREGWEVIGTVLVPAGPEPRINLTLGSSGGIIAVSPSTAAAPTTAPATAKPQ